MVDIVSIVIAVISLVGTVVTSIITAWMSYYQDDRKRRHEAEAVLSKYCDPLLLAAQDFQSKLYNFTEQGLTRWIALPEETGIRRTTSERAYIIKHTCFVFGQFLAWVYILRREVQFLRFDTDARSKALATTLAAISRTLSTGMIVPVLDGHGRINESRTSAPLPCVIYTGEQRAIGEIMTVTDTDGQPRCMGYAAFCERWDEDKPHFRGWFSRLEHDLVVLARAELENQQWHAPDHRLRRLQHLLVDFIHELDPKGVSYEPRLTQLCKPAPYHCPCQTCKNVSDPSVQHESVEPANEEKSRPTARPIRRLPRSSIENSEVENTV